MAINCNACEELRENAPDFVVNELTDTMCTSLKNNTGLNPSNSNTNCDDLHDANDCLIGRMAQDVEAYEVCGWKEYMKKYATNLYNVLKAIICWLCGLQDNVDALTDTVDNICDTIDNVLNLISGASPKNHYGEWTQYWKDHVTLDDDYQWEYFLPSFGAEIRNGAGCSSSKKLGLFLATMDYTDDIYPRVFGFSFTSPIARNEVIAVIPRSAVPDSDMTLARWKNMLRVNNTYEWGMFGGDSILYIGAAGYTVIDGVEFNTHLRQYGEDNLVYFIHSIVGGGTTGHMNTSRLNLSTRTYNA